MKLWKVTLTINVVAQAATESAAIAEAKDALTSGVMYGEIEDAEVSVDPVTSADQLDSELANALPWGGDGVRTCKKILEATK